MAAGPSFTVPRLAQTYSHSVVDRAIMNAVNYLGYRQLTDEQREVVCTFLGGRNVFVSLPTGSGKSLCYACLPLVFDALKTASAEGDRDQRSIVVVLAPLTALMQDQVASFREKGLSAACVGGRHCALQSVVGDEELVATGKAQLVYMTPETVLSEPMWREMVRSPTYRSNLVGLAIDEAHLVEKWGKDFRMDFSRIAEIRSLMPHNCNILALTATANPATRSMVIKSLEMQGCSIVAVNPNKPNIKYIVALKPTDVNCLVSRITQRVAQWREKSDRTIIFCRTYDDCSLVFEVLALELNKLNLLTFSDASGSLKRVCEKFTACSSALTKNKILTSFTSPDGILRIVVATVAFGMGLDTPNVRHVIHWGPPEDVELYIQESGRGGRDGAATTATLYYKKADLSGASHVTDLMQQYCTNSTECRRKLLMCLFSDDALSLPTYMHQCCDICELLCTCDVCNPSITTPDLVTTNLICHSQRQGQSNSPTATVQINKKEFRAKLVCYRTELANNAQPAMLLVGIDVLTGLTNACIDAIVENAHQISSPKDLLHLGVTSHEYCEPILMYIRNFTSYNE